MAKLREFQDDPDITWDQVKTVLRSAPIEQLKSALYYAVSYLAAGNDHDDMNEADMRYALLNGFASKSIYFHGADHTNDAS